MKYCQDCGTRTQPLNTNSSGCGGFGRMIRCPNEACDQVWEQTSGGFLPTPGGERWSRVTKFTTYQGQLAHLCRPHKLQEEGKWGFWDELYDKHGPYDSEEAARVAIKMRAKTVDREYCHCCRKLSLEEHLCKTCRRCPHCKCFEHCPNVINIEPHLFEEN